MVCKARYVVMVSWGNLVNDFVKKNGYPSNICRGFGPFKRKFTEFPKNPKVKEPNSSFPTCFTKTCNIARQNSSNGFLEHDD